MQAREQCWGRFQLIDEGNSYRVQRTAVSGLAEGCKADSSGTRQKGGANCQQDESHQAPHGILLKTSRQVVQGTLLDEPGFV